MLIATGVSLFLCPLSWQGKETDIYKYVYANLHIYRYLFTFLYVNSFMSSKLKMSSYWCLLCYSIAIYLSLSYFWLICRCSVQKCDNWLLPSVIHLPDCSITVCSCNGFKVFSLLFLWKQTDKNVCQLKCSALENPICTSSFRIHSFPKLLNSAHYSVPPYWCTHLQYI